MSRDTSPSRTRDRRPDDVRARSRSNAGRSGRSRPSDDRLDDEEPRTKRDNDNFREIDRVMREITKNWQFMTEGEFNPVNVALALMDGSSLGQDYTIFRDMMLNLERALQFIVNDYYQGFNTSIGTYGGIMQNIRDSQLHIRQMRAILISAKDALSTRRVDLLQMWNMSQQYKEVIRILDSIEELKTVPEKLENFLSEKHFLTAVDLLMDALKTAEKKDLMDIGAVQDLFNYLKGQESSILEILIEELHNHLYLKSPYCGGRWADYVRGQEVFPNIQFGDALLARNNDKRQNDGTVGVKNKKNLIVNTRLAMPNQQPLKSPIALFMEQQRGQERLTEDLDRNPETDSFYYIEVILESLVQLGKLQFALDIVGQRLPLELYQLVDKTIAEVDERNTDALRNAAAARTAKRSSTVRLAQISSMQEEAEAETLRDLLWTLFSKFDAVLQGHRVIHEVTLRISQRKEFISSGLSYPFVEIWRPIQSEVRTLLHDYLTDEQDDVVAVRNTVVSINEVLREKKYRDRNKAVFRFANTSEKDKTARTVDSDLEKILKISVPGLMTQTQESTITQLGITAATTDERYAAGHRLLIKADAFNVSVLFQPTLAFLDKVTEIMPSGGRQPTMEFNSFLDDFVLNVFLPQLEDKVIDFYHETVGGVDTFQEDPNYSKVSERPIVKSTISIMQFVHTLCRTLKTMPFHRQAYSGLIISILIQYYQKCFDRYKELITPDSFLVGDALDGASASASAQHKAGIKVSADWAQHEPLHDLLNKFSTVDPSQVQDLRSLLGAETKMELDLADKSIIQPASLVLDGKRILGLAQLYTSLKWFVGQVWALRMSSSGGVPETPASTAATPRGVMATNTRRWALVDTPVTATNKEPSDIDLPLNKEMSQRFDSLLATYQQLAESCLFTLHIEFRLHTIWFLEKATREGNYNLDEPALEPDPHIIDLNADLVACDEFTVDALPVREHRFMFEGLADLMDQVLCRNSRNLKALNGNGVGKMIRNIRALQQNLKNIIDQPHDVGFDKARRFYDLHGRGGKSMMKSIRDGGPQYTFDEYKAMLNLIYGMTGDEAAKDTKSQNSRMYNEQSIELTELLIDDW